MGNVYMGLDLVFKLGWERFLNLKKITKNWKTRLKFAPKELAKTFWSFKIKIEGSSEKEELDNIIKNPSPWTPCDLYMLKFMVTFASTLTMGKAH
jgi:hypothetical protein